MIDLDGVKLVRFLYGDPSGVIRGKQVHAARMGAALASGLGLTRAQNAINLLDDLVPVPGMEPVGEIRIVADPATFVRLPWLAGRGERAVRPGRARRPDWGACPRVVPAARGRRRSRRPACASRRPSRTSSTWPRPPPMGRGRGPTARSTPRRGSTGPPRSSTTSSTRSTNRASRSNRRSTSTGRANRRSRSPAPTRSPRPTGSCGCATPSAAWPRPATACSPRSRRSPTPTTSAAAATCTSRSGRATATPWRPTGDPFGLSATARAFLAGVLDHLPALVALTCPSFLSYARLLPVVVGGLDGVVGVRQPGGRAPHRLAVPRPGGREPQRRAEDVRREQQPAPRAGRAHPRRASTA